jgi:hypothetical protein
LEKISTIQPSMDRLDTLMLILVRELSEMEKILPMIKIYLALAKELNT